MSSQRSNNVRHRYAMKRQFRNFVRFAFAVWPGLAYPWCESHPALEDEVRSSDVVLIGQVLSDRETPDPPRAKDVRLILDPGHTYTLAVSEVLRGKPRERIELFAEYNSGQFPMDVGKRYLVIASGDERAFMVDSCGNSGEVGERAREVESVRTLSKERG
jgi:hypothetical protein